jgi:hypothetical protein
MLHIFSYMRLVQNFWNVLYEHLIFRCVMCVDDFFYGTVADMQLVYN